MQGLSINKKKSFLVHVNHYSTPNLSKQMAQYFCPWWQASDTFARSSCAKASSSLRFDVFCAAVLPLTPDFQTNLNLETEKATPRHSRTDSLIALWLTSGQECFEITVLLECWHTSMLNRGDSLTFPATDRLQIHIAEQFQFCFLHSAELWPIQSLSGTFQSTLLVLLGQVCHASWSPVQWSRMLSVPMAETDTFVAAFIRSSCKSFTFFAAVLMRWFRSLLSSSLSQADLLLCHCQVLNCHTKLPIMSLGTFLDILYPLYFSVMTSSPLSALFIVVTMAATLLERIHGSCLYKDITANSG